MQLDQQPIVDPQHPYAEFINPHAHRLASIFDIHETDRKDVPETAIPFPLQMHCRVGGEERPIFLYTFRFPVSPQTYVAALVDIPLQCKLDTLIDSYSRLPTPMPSGSELLFLSYKKILILMPRYFHYLRHSFQRGEDLYLLSVSVPGGPSAAGTLGEIVLTVSRIRGVAGGCEVSVYSQVDMRMKLKWEVAMARGFAEIRKWLVRFHAALAG